MHCHVGLASIWMTQHYVRTGLPFNDKASALQTGQDLTPCKALSEISTVEKKNSDGSPIASPAAFFSVSQSLIKSSAAARGPFNSFAMCRETQRGHMCIIKT